MHKDHEIHARRRSRNIWLGAILGGFVLLVWAVTIVKMSHGDAMQGFDHVLRPELLPAEE